MIPLMLDLSDAKVLLFGAGAVGMRKLGPFLNNCKKITVISKEIPDTLPSFVLTKICDISKLSDTELRKLIEENDVIIAALSNNELNDKICFFAKNLSKLYNSSNGNGNFMLPAVFRDGDFVFTASTGGKAPAVPGFIRDRIKSEFENIGEMIELQSILREKLKQTCDFQSKRAEILRKVLEDDEIRNALKSDKQKALELANKYLQE